MTTYKRINGNYDIVTLGTDDEVSITSSALTVTGNLTVQGTTTTVNSTDLDIKDRVVVLNKGETGAGVTGTYAGLEVDRGTLQEAKLVYDDSQDQWVLDQGDGILIPIVKSESGFTDLIDDKSPQLGGDLDVNGFRIISVSDGNIVLAPDGTGMLQIDNAAVRLQNEASDPTGEAGHTTVYSKAPGPGGSGLYAVTDTTSDELVSKTKAIIYSIIF